MTTATPAPAASAPSPPLRPAASSPASLFQTLQSISDLLNAAVVRNDLAFAFTLNDSVRRHFVTPLRRKLYLACPAPYSQPVLDAPYEHRATAALVHRLLCALLLRSPPASLAHALHHILRELTALPPPALAFSVLSAVWADLAALLRSHLYLWFAAALVEDPRSQFFISEAREPAVIPERLPPFITPLVADRILFIGNVQKCRIVLAKERGDTPPPPENLNDFENLLTNPLSAELEIEAATLKWRIDAAHHLSQILPFDRIRERMLSLRQYLLLGHAAFWRSFFDELRSKPLLLISRDLDPQERHNVEKTVMQILSFTFQDFASENTSLGKSSSVESPLKLQVTETGNIVPQFTLSFAESRVLASKSSVYCDVFSITFNVRRVACELRDAYAKLQFLDRQLRKVLLSKRRRVVTACLVQIRELRRCMANFVDGFEWYLQADVLQPKFESLLALLDAHLKGIESVAQGPSRKPFFDTVYSLHESLLDKVFAQCFVGQGQINNRLDGIFTACFSLCDFVQELTVDALCNDCFIDTLNALDMSFSRNVGLLVRLLLHMQHSSADSRIAALLARINFNHYLQP